MVAERSRAKLPPITAPTVRRSQRSEDENLYVRDALATLWSGRIVVGALTVLSIIVALAWLQLQTPLYTVTAYVAPVPLPSGLRAESESGNPIQALFSATGSVPTTSVSPFQEYLALLHSRSLALALQDKLGLLQHVYAGRWDAERRQWRPPSGVRAWLGGLTRSLFGLPWWVPPDAEQITRYLEDNVRISALRDVSIRKIEVSDHDPAFALRLFNAVNEETDRIVRESALTRAKTQIDYIDSEMQHVTNAARREALTRILLEQEQSLMLMKIGLPYAARTIGAPGVSTLPTYPRVGLTLGLAAMAGLVLGMCAVFVLYSLRPKFLLQLPWVSLRTTSL